MEIDVGWHEEFFCCSLFSLYSLRLNAMVSGIFLILVLMSVVLKDFTFKLLSSKCTDGLLYLCHNDSQRFNC